MCWDLSQEVQSAFRTSILSGNIHGPFGINLLFLGRVVNDTKVYLVVLV